MNVWQLFTAGLAVVLPVVFALRLARTPRWNIVVLMAQVVAIPEVAFVTYSLFGGAIPSLGLLVPVAVLLYGGALAVMAWSVYERRKLLRPVVTIVMIERQHLAALLSRVAMVLFLSAVTFVFEPWLAVANVVANAAWMLAWIPSRWRGVHLSASVDVAAAPHQVFSFISNTDNWPKYRDDFIRAEPPGVLAAGTEVVTRVSVLQMSRPNPKMARFAEVRSVVTSVAGDDSITTTLVGRPSETGSSRVTAIASGTRVTSESRGRVLFTQAALGLKFDMGSVLVARRAAMEKTIVSLKQVLEAPATK